MISFDKLKKSFRYAGEGFKFAWKNDQNLRVHLAAGVLVILFGFFLGVTRIELSILLVMVILVLWAEMINTTVEKTIDLITSEHHQNAKIVKDVSSAMVLLTAIGAVLVGVVIFLPYFF